ncbi:MAG: hypothetical protein APR54_03940 [Candidatus Cloacimonas sp. SDB]|nr:MAG: hypothetical protein APR54_03940 [Candidatus Cloacimonas sp. SDB]
MRLVIWKNIVVDPKMKKSYFILIISLVVFQLFTQEVNPDKSSKNLPDQERIELLLRMAEESIPGSLDKARTYTTQAQELSRQLNDISNQVQAILLLGEIYKTQGNYISAFREFYQALELAELNKKDHCIIDSYIYLAKFFNELDDFDEATKYLFKGLDRAKHIRDNKRSAKANMELSYNYFYKKEYDLSVLYAEEAVKYFLEEQEDKQQASCYILLGKNYLNLKDNEKASYYANKVLELTENNDDYTNRALAYNDLGWNSYINGDFNQALEYNMKALEIRHKIDYVPWEVSSLLNIADLFTEWERYEDALTFYEQAFETMGNMDDHYIKDLRKKYYNRVSELYYKLGEFDKAYENFSKFYEIDLELREIKNNKSLNYLRSQYEIERYYKEQEAYSNLQKNEIKKQEIIISAALIIFVLTIILILFLFSRYNLKKKLNLQLSETNKKLESINKKANLEIAEKQKMEKIIISNADHLKLINRILRHDIANDLATIKSGLSVYKSSRDDKILEELKKRVDKSVKLIHNMREFEDFMNNHKSLKVVNVNKILADLAGNYPDTDLNVMGEGEVIADESLSSVLENIIRNAVEHGKVKSVDIEISGNETVCEIKITDMGKGIPDSVKDKIFAEGFYYGSTGNTGMGLFIARKTLESFGGSLSYKNNQPQGSVFVIKLRKAI